MQRGGLRSLEIGLRDVRATKCIELIEKGLMCAGMEFIPDSVLLSPSLREVVRKVTTVEDTIDLIEADLTPIQEFYNKSNVFITGCTGFLGQLVLEKLLRSCPISKVYLLVRDKKGTKVNARLDNIFGDPLFQRLRNQMPDFRKKVIGIEGDCTLPDLGLSDINKQLLIKNVDIVFHVAATVRFDEKLKTAVLINVRATRDVLWLARQMTRLKCFMHVSTIYCNCLYDVIEEETYPAAANYEAIISIAENLPDVLEKVSDKMVGQYPNTYTFTKQIAEDVIEEEGKGLPVGIHRPGIGWYRVLSTYKEPVRGWINNIHGPIGVSIAFAMGVMRTIYCELDYNANMVPADMCINSLLAAAWEVGTSYRERMDEYKFKVPVYHFESNSDNPISWKWSVELGRKCGVLVPSKMVLWCVSIYMTNSYVLYWIYSLFVHTLPAILVDGILLSLGKPRMAMDVYRKIDKMLKVIKFFSTREWTINSRRMRKLLENMTVRDREIFLSDLREMKWVDYFECYIAGARIHFLKDPMTTLPGARKRYKRLIYCN
ncbi:hypothetical protein NQ318_003341 [Aromia moschata]|uniref:Fatty acyl-CoA reductase n=1 Tax=Aromia moschata TaxID=1265417 RepID=A0AAV8XHF6_9CUCU|nr:hypothetical protein NQ318_003341 [Aromia moschata]